MLMVEGVKVTAKVKVKNLLLRRSEPGQTRCADPMDSQRTWYGEPLVLGYCFPRPGSNRSGGRGLDFPVVAYPLSRATSR